MDRSARNDRRNTALAIGLAFLLGALWLRKAWNTLSVAVLPDGDDMVRLAEVRDWLAGQRFTDLTQHRLGLDGSGALHWSRLGDIGIAAWIVVLRPALGAQQAEIWAAILYPLCLFALALWLSARLAQHVGDRGQATIAILVAAFAFPAITMFVPGRIDHHGLQLVGTLVLVDAVLIRRGLVAGVVAAVMLAIGLETAPLLIVGMGVIAVDYARNPAARSAFAKFGGALGATTLGWLLVARPEVWPSGWCDGFTPASTNATFVAAGWFALVALAPVKRRIVAGLALAIPAIAVGWQGSAVCANGPFGPVDPLVARLWLANVEEARPLFADGLGHAIAFGALAAVGLIVTATMACRARERVWLILLAFQAAAVAVTLLQIRGASAAAALAVPALAAMITAARKRDNAPLLLGAWLVSAGLLWSLVGQLLDARGVSTAVVRGAGCTAPETLRQLAALPPGLMIAPVDAGAYLIGATRHRVLAAPYHRNSAGNRAAYDFWLANDELARAKAEALKADYVLACPDAFGGIALPAASMAVRLDRGETPQWLTPISLPHSAAHLYRVVLASNRVVFADRPR